MAVAESNRVFGPALISPIITNPVMIRPERNSRNTARNWNLRPSMILRPAVGVTAGRRVVSNSVANNNLHLPIPAPENNGNDELVELLIIAATRPFQ